MPPPAKTVSVQSTSHILEENGVRLKLSITDTPGFGDLVDNKDVITPICDYVNAQFESYLKDEIAVNRPQHIEDHRVHCCVYFIAPSGHGLKPLDLAFMKRLHNVCNIIPVIGKSDSLTLAERAAFKERIQEDMENAGIKLFLGHVEDEDEDEENRNSSIRATMPFAVVGSNCEKELEGKMVMGRQTRIGFLNVEDPAHCEFVYLRNMIMCTHLQELKDTTALCHYENFRRSRLNPASESSA